MINILKDIIRGIINWSVWNLGEIISLNARFRDNKNDRKLSIIGIDGIGDFVLFTPTLKYIRNKYNGYFIVIILQERVSKLAENCHYIDSIIQFNKVKYRRNIFYKLAFLYKMYSQKFTICINPVYSRDRITDEMLLYSSAKENIGWDTQFPNMTEKEKERGDKIYTKLFKSNLKKYDHELERNKEFLLDLGIKMNGEFIIKNYWSKKEVLKANNIYKKHNLAGENVIAIVPGALSKLRKWRSENWHTLMKKVVKKNNKIYFLIVGSIDDKDFIKLSLNESFGPNVINICGLLSVNELAPLFEMCTLVIGNETGPMHIAIATGVPTITILGGGHFERFMPYSMSEKNKFIYKKMKCFQCDWQCIYKDNKCLSVIKVEDVLITVKEMILNIK